MERVLTILSMATGMRVGGRKICGMAKAEKYSLMAQYMKECGQRTSVMGQALTPRKRKPSARCGPMGRRSRKWPSSQQQKNDRNI